MDLKWIERGKIRATLDVEIQRRPGPFGCGNHDPAGRLVSRRILVINCSLPNRPGIVAFSVIELGISKAVCTYCVD